MKRWKTESSVRRGFVAAALALLIGVVAIARLDAGHTESQPAIATDFSLEKLERAGDYIRNEIATGKIPGAILLIQQHGKPVHFENFGVGDVASKRPMTADTIFRLYSM